jgi:hypothetical protein
MPYTHTQPGRWPYVLFAFTAATVAGAWLARRDPGAVVILVAIAAVFALCGLVFGSMTIRDEGDCLALRFGPLPLLSKKIRYADITGVEIGRTTILDGWGTHFMPGRCWTYNVWGFACVKLTLGRKIVRVGSDDAEGLAKVIREKNVSVNKSPALQAVVLIDPLGSSRPLRNSANTGRRAEAARVGLSAPGQAVAFRR